ncbi:DNRLRE domain-containing protein [Zavarzinella formosa]|uniref:DNRLRE domain-containing protein n=1 Tax=Zavarzinella formosa TaxID=360055 RepID=UPI0002FC6286|nr:DNRLRE domain-containing protein [Zavarzinella formosa]
MLRSLGLLALLLISDGWSSAADVPPEKSLYDFENEADLKTWANLELPDAKDKEPPVKFELSGDHATSGKHSLKLTFAGGLWPTITTTQVTQDWLAYKTFKADVFADRHCVIGFTLHQEKSIRGEGWDPVISRWTKTVFLKPGKNEIIATLAGANDYAVHAKWGKAVRFEIFMYSPREGESVHVDNIRLGNDKPAPETPTKITIAGTDWTVSAVRSSSDGCRELGRNVAHFWNKPPVVTVEQIEESFQTKLAEVKKRFPKAVLAVLRDGEKGFDPTKPEQAYAGWKDAYWNSHGPDTAFAERARNRGKSASQEIFMRHRSPLMRVDFSSIPAGSNILAAQLIVTRVSERTGDENNPEKRANMWVVEPCNRPWEEYEVNAFEYAKDKFWKDIGGFQMGEDPDFLPIFLAWGPGRPGKVNAWDFTQAVKYWTDGKHANHGFMLHGDSGDYMTAHTREAAEIKNRPAVLVIYVPK